MSKPNRDAFTTVQTYDIGSVGDLGFSLEVWANDRTCCWVLAFYGPTVREHVGLDDQTAAMLLRSAAVSDQGIK